MILSILRYVANMLILFLSVLSAYFMFPIYYIVRNKDNVLKRILWIYSDDEDGVYGAEYWRKAKNITKNNFFIAYRWCVLRNPAWNLHTLIRPKQGQEREIRSFGKLYKNFKRVTLDNMTVIHHVDENGNWNNNSGKYISMTYSIIGNAFYFFEKNNKKYFRYSAAFRLFNIGVKSVFIETQLGTSKKRHLFKFKIKFKEVY